MPATATDRLATAPMLSYLERLHAERVDFGYDPEIVYTFREIHNLIDTGKRADRKGVPTIEPGYYITPDKIVHVVIRSKTNPERTYAKVLVVRAKCRATWEYVPGAVRELIGLVPLTPIEAGQLGRQHGVCVICAKTLTTPSSVRDGIGPVCMKRLIGTTAEDFLPPVPKAPSISVQSIPLLPLLPIDDLDDETVSRYEWVSECTCEDYDGERRCPSCMARIRTGLPV